MKHIYLVYEALEYEGWWILGAYSNVDAALEHQRIVQDNIKYNKKGIIVRKVAIWDIVPEPSSLTKKHVFGDGSFDVDAVTMDQEKVDG
jgi:hypothetical protein